MAYDPRTGEWKEQDESVATRMTGLMSQNNEFMRQATTRGLQDANRRGLANSSIGVQAAESSRIAAALPIAQQEATQAHNANRQGREHQLAKVLQANDLAAQAERQQASFKFTAGENELDRALQARMQGLDIASREQMQRFDLQLREQLSALDREAQERIAQMQVASSERHSAASLAASLEQSYAQIMAGIMANPDIPASVRQQYMDHASAVRSSNLALVEQMYNFRFDFGGGAGGTGASSGTQPVGSPTVVSGGSASGSTPGQQYLAANPDVAQYYQNNPRALAQFGGDLDEAARFHYETYGRAEGRQGAFASIR